MRYMRYFDGTSKYNNNQGVSYLILNEDNIMEKMIAPNIMKYVNEIIEADEKFSSVFKPLTLNDVTVHGNRGSSEMDFNMALGTKDGEPHDDVRKELFEILAAEF